MSARRDEALNWLAILSIALLLLAFLLSFWMSIPPRGDLVPAAAVTMLPAPTATVVLQTPVSAALPSTPTPLPGQIAVGVYVQIQGTGGDGLRIRAAAGLDGEPLFLGFDSEVFQVLDGPQLADGYVWWFISSPYDPNRGGWAVENYLEVVEQ